MKFEKELDVFENKFWKAQTLDDLEGLFKDPIIDTVQEKGDWQDRKKVAAIVSDATRHREELSR